MKRFLLIATMALLTACGGGGNTDTAATQQTTSFLAPEVRMAQLAFTPATQDELYQFFAVAFGAAPGVTYMGQLLDAANAGMTIKQIVNVFTTKYQFTDVYPTTLSNTDFAIKLVDNVVGSSATAQAKASAVNDVVSALEFAWTRGDVIFAIFTNLAGKPSADPYWAGTSQQMKNQVVYAKYFTEVMRGDSTDLPTLQKVIANVTPYSNTATGIEQAISGVVCSDGGYNPVVTPLCAGTSTVGITIVSPVATGEIFKFVLGTTSLTIRAAVVSTKFPVALANGTTYTVSQSDGPRSCTASANRSGTIANANVEVTMDCGKPPGPAAVSGQLHAPVGTVVVLQNNGGDDLALTMSAFNSSIDTYNLMPFTFATMLFDGNSYQVTVKTAPTGQICRVFKGSTGTLPLATEALRVGCEYIYEHVSRSTDRAVRGTYFDSSAPAIGGAAVPVGRTADVYGEGRFVAFVSYTAGMAGATGSKRQVFWRDRLSGETVLVSASAAGVEGNGDSFAPAISADGLTVAFESYASNLVASDSNAVRDVFVWSAINPSLGALRVSVGTGGIQANAESFEPTLSGDGNVVAFSSGASNLTAGVSGTSTINVYRRDLTAGSNTLVSASSTGLGVGGSRPALSEDGNKLAFYSYSAAITAGDGNGLWDIFVYDHSAATNTRVSLTKGGGERNAGTESASRVVAPAISGNGRYVAFATTATNMVAGDSNGAQDVFVVDTQNGSVIRASVGSSGMEGNSDSPVGQGERLSLSYEGDWVSYSTNASNLGTAAGNAVMHNLITGETRVLSNMSGSSVSPVVVSRSGAYAVFGAGNALDQRFTSTGLFVRFTDIGSAFWWY